MRFKSLISMLWADNKMIIAFLMMLLNIFFLSVTLTSKVRFVGQDSLMGIINLFFFFLIIVFFNDGFIRNSRYYINLSFTRKEIINKLFLINGVVAFIISMCTAIYLSTVVGNGERYLFLNYEGERVGMLSSLLVFINAFIILYFLCSFATVFSLNSGKVWIFYIVYACLSSVIRYFDKTDTVIKTIIGSIIGGVDFFINNGFISLPMNSFLLIILIYFFYKISLKKIMKMDIL